MRASFLSCSVLFFSFTPAMAGDLLTYKEEGKGAGYVRLHLDSGRMKAELSENGQDVKGTMIFKTQGNEALILDHKRKEYVALTKEEMKKLAGTMNSAMEKMKAAMSKLPPGMQKMMKEKMGAMGQGKKEPVQIKKAKSGEKVGQWTADRYEVSSGKKLVSRVWTAPIGKVGADPENFKSMKAMSEAFAEIGSEIGKVLGGGGAEAAQIELMNKMEGFPVKSVSVDSKGKDGRAYLLESVQKKTFNDSEFAVPSGFKKKNIAMKAME